MAAGYNASAGRPGGMIMAAGYNASTGQPEGTTMTAGYNASAGRPEGTTVAAGCNVGMLGGCPEGTTLDRGYFNIPIDLELASDTCNIDVSLSTKLGQRIGMQRAFDQQALITRMCWQCGCVLWGYGSNKGTYIINPPKGMWEKNAPANAFLKA